MMTKIFIVLSFFLWCFITGRIWKNGARNIIEAFVAFCIFGITMLGFLIILGVVK